MNRKGRRTRAKLQTKTAAELRARSSRADTAKEVVDTSHHLFELGKIKEALPELLQAVVTFPADPGVRGALAYALASTGQISSAIEQYRNLSEMQPDTVAVITNLAFLLLQTGKLDEARELLERAANLAPGHANTVFALAELLGRQKQQNNVGEQSRFGRWQESAARVHWTDAVQLRVRMSAAIRPMDSRCAAAAPEVTCGSEL